MTSKQKAWFKSAFDAPSDATADCTKSGDPPPPVRKPATSRKRAANSAIFNATALDATIDLTTTHDDDAPPIHVAPVPLRHGDITATASWLENFAPRTVDDLAIHAKKIAEVQQWLHSCSANRRRRPAPMLCISGPAGAGKTATLRLLAQIAGYTVQEWVQPVDVELSAPRGCGGEDGPVFAESQTLLFEQFLFRASRYGSVFEAPAATGPSTRLVLVEDFPNVFVRNPEEFNDVLQHYSEYGKSPLVFIVTDSRSRKMDLAYTLFGEATRAKYGIDVIAFNAVSSTMLKRGLKRVAAIMAQPAFARHYKTMAPDAVESIVLTAQGDLRNAVINMHVAAQKSSGQLPVEGGQTKVKSTSRTKKPSKLKSLGCDETLTCMHALGRILNPKYSDERPDRLLHSPEQLADDFTSQPSNLLNLLYANYACHFRQIEDVLRAADSLSTADVLLSEWRDEGCALSALTVAVRGLMTANRSPASGWHPIRGQRKLTVSAVEEDLRRQFGIGRAVSAKVMAADYRTFAKVIADQRQSSGKVKGTITPEEDEDGVKLLEQSIVW